MPVPRAVGGDRRAAADRSELTRFDQMLTSGGDERIELDRRGLNRYHLDPRSRAGMFTRGSCTCSPITDDGRVAAGALLPHLFDDLQHDAVCETQRQRLLDVFAPRHGASAIFSPSGSDLCYLPLLFSSLVRPGERIINIVACSEELGSGSILAHEGRFYAARSPAGDALPIGQPISSTLDVEPVFLPARDGDGAIVDHAREIERVIDEHRGSGSIVANLVIGSKSGIENSVSVIERLRSEDVIWTVDLCQMRATKPLFSRLLELDCLLFCTGSKFYEAPPFCGAMIAPQAWIERLASVEQAPTSGFDRIFTASDFPSELANLRRRFPATANPGLRLRWEAALVEMEQFALVPESSATELIAHWNASVTERMAASSHFELLRDQAQTLNSIVSFRLRSGGGYLTRDALAGIHRRLATETIPELAPYRSALIGQPVSYATGSFLRLAIGSSDMRRAHGGHSELDTDMALIDSIERLARG